MKTEDVDTGDAGGKRKQQGGKQADSREPDGYYRTGTHPAGGSRQS